MIQQLCFLQYGLSVTADAHLQPNVPDNTIPIKQKGGSSCSSTKRTDHPTFGTDEFAIVTQKVEIQFVFFNKSAV